MGTISLDDAVAGTQIVASLINNNNTTLEGLLNGSIDASNISSTKFITPSTHLAQDGAATSDVLRWDGSAWSTDAIDSFFTMPGAVLGMVEYNPTPVQTATTTSATGVDVDSTNLSLQVAVPSSGKIMVCLSAVAAAATGIPSSGYWGVRESTTMVVQRKLQGTAVAVRNRFWMFMYASGISPGVHTYKFALRTSYTAQTVGIEYGDTNGSAGTGTSDPGAAQMMIWAVP